MYRNAQLLKKSNSSGFHNVSQKVFIFFFGSFLNWVLAGFMGCKVTLGPINICTWIAQTVLHQMFLGSPAVTPVQPDIDILVSGNSAFRCFLVGPNSSLICCRRDCPIARRIVGQKLRYKVLRQRWILSTMQLDKEMIDDRRKLRAFVAFADAIVSPGRGQVLNCTMSAIMSVWSSFLYLATREMNSFLAQFHISALQQVELEKWKLLVSQRNLSCQKNVTK